MAWHCKHEHLFGSVGDDKQLIIWDTRKAPAASATLLFLYIISVSPVLTCRVKSGQQRRGGARLSKLVASVYLKRSSVTEQVGGVTAFLCCC